MSKSNLELSVEVEKPSDILRKLKIKVPANVVKLQLEKGLIAVQKTAKLKGFRPGQAPISIIKQYYGEDVRHRVFHTLIDESFDKAIRDHSLRAVGRPKIETPDHQTGTGDHDHTLHDDKDLTFIATCEVMPDLDIKGYTGLSITEEKVEITDEQVEAVVSNLLNSQAQIVPVEEGLALTDGSSSRAVQKGDFADVQFTGGLVTEQGVVQREDMKGARMIEVGLNQWIPGFEDQLIGITKGQTKTFKLQFPADFSQAEMAGKEAEFTVTVNEIKEKKLPTLDDDFATQLGYESVKDVRVKAADYLEKEKTAELERNVRTQLLSQIIEKNPFEIPTVLIEGQARALAQEWAEELKSQGYQEKLVQMIVSQDVEGLKKRAEGQVRASLILEAIAKEEKISVSEDEVESEMERLSKSMNVDRDRLDEFYGKNPSRKEDLEFRLRQEQTLKFIIGQAKVKSA